jgi:hypothetical protein
LTTNLSKRKYSFIGEKTGDLDLGNNQTITICVNCKYSGVRVGRVGRDEKEIRERIVQGLRAMEYDGIRKYLRIDYNTYNTIIRSTVLYGSEVWR